MILYMFVLHKTIYYLLYNLLLHSCLCIEVLVDLLSIYEV